MANLIIKSSADNLVLQGSDASPAITVGATGTTTFAENATLSGTANALGTVTTGNISNSAIVYPTGHIRFLATSALSNTGSSAVSRYTVADLSTGTFTAGSRILMQWQMGGFQKTAGNAGYGQIHACGISASTGTATHSGLGAGSSGLQMVQEIGYNKTATASFEGFNFSLLVTPTNGATQATYNVYYAESQDQTIDLYKCQLMLWEVF
jgi:hypothetical protein